MPLWPLAPVAPSSVEAGPLAGRSWHGPVDGFTVDNDLVRVTGRDTTPSFALEFWDGTAWRAKAIDVWLSLLPLQFSKASVLENRPEVCVVQYEMALNAGGRITVDVTLRRGMRFAMFQVNTNKPDILSASPNPTEAMTKTNERELSTLADANGHRLLIGSPRTWTHTPSTGLLTRSGAKSLSFYVGLELSGAASGDTAADLSMQALGALWEQVRVLRRA